MHSVNLSCMKEIWCEDVYFQYGGTLNCSYLYRCCAGAWILRCANSVKTKRVSLHKAFSLTVSRPSAEKSNFSKVCQPNAGK